MNMKNKSLGRPGDAPKVCQANGCDMSKRGWIVFGYMVTCLACRNTFVNEELLYEKVKKA